MLNGSNAVPLYLAAAHHRATQLLASCNYWLATELEAASRHEQWAELPAEARARAKEEHARLVQRRDALRKIQAHEQQIQCVLAEL